MGKEFWVGLFSGIILFILLLIILIIIFIYVIIPTVEDNAINTFTSNYTQALIQSCENSNYLNYYDLPTNDKLTFENAYDFEISKALLSFAMNVSTSNCSNLNPLPKPIHYQIVAKLLSTVPGKDGKDGKLNTNMYGYVFYSKERNQIIIAFTGTFYLSEWYEDFQFESVPVGGQLNNSNSEVEAHYGFLTIYNGLKTQLRNLIARLDSHATIFITGHSLGGALASLTAMDFATYYPIVYTFASPRVFNNEGAILLNSLLPSTMRIFKNSIGGLKPPLLF